MKIPPFLTDLINSDHTLAGIVNEAIARFEPWIANSQMPLFPEYTDHSIRHLEEVMATSAELATDAAKEILSPLDASILVLAVCLHDCAMHLTEDGFITLTAPNSEWKGISTFDSVPWDTLWGDFLAEARRFDGRKLVALFGDSDPIRVPPTNVTQLTKRDRLLMGEFIRRHHARLAHEIAIFGIPGANGAPIPVIARDERLGQWISDLAGLVARSHGVPLRSNFGYLKQYYDLRDFNKVHAIFLMSLIRIADYLQIQAKRAPTETLQVRKLNSPISQIEWKVHDSVRNITAAGDDPEAIFVRAEPENVATFLRVKEWLSGIQYELDVSWAVLGEVYGRFAQERLDTLKLRLRRIKSNLDDISAFSTTVSYVPQKVAFEAANPDLLKLLVGPLYGENAAFGLRELLQNSVDAVRERREYCGHHPDANHQMRDLPADIQVRIECDSKGMPTRLIISDSGIGMNSDIVIGYFLKAGASFRKSDAWKKEYEDASGRSRVLRSGRFGVGVLAAFLIGDRIRVTTRHIECSEQRAIAFNAGLDDSSISLNWVAAPVGTEIVVNIPESMRDHVRSTLGLYGLFESHKSANNIIEFSHALAQYTCSDPTVDRLVVNESTKVAIRLADYTPSLNDVDQIPWRHFQIQEYARVFWTYGKPHGRNTQFPALTCNGILVEARRPAQWEGESTLGRMLLDVKSLRAPAICVFDPDGRLPLNLQRNNLAQPDRKLSGALLNSVVDDFLVHALLEGPKEGVWDSKTDQFLRGNYPGLNGNDRGFVSDAYKWFIGRAGFGFAESELICATGHREVLFLYLSYGLTVADRINIAQAASQLVLDGMCAVLCFNFDIGQVNLAKQLYRGLLSRGDDWFSCVPGSMAQTGSAYYPGIKVDTRIVGVPWKNIETLIEGGPGGTAKAGVGLRGIFDNARASGVTKNGWLRLECFGKCQKMLDFLDKILVHIQSGFLEGVAICKFPDQGKVQSGITERWLARLGSSIIPYENISRQKTFAELECELQQPISRWNYEIKSRKE